MEIKFSKYHGLGNDFIIIDNTDNRDVMLDRSIRNKMCCRQLGIGADGLIELVNKQFIELRDPVDKQSSTGLEATIPTGTGEEWIGEQAFGNTIYFNYFNADGKIGSLCGNGARCVMAFVRDKGRIHESNMKLVTCDGIHDGGMDTELGLIYVTIRDISKIIKYDEENFFLDDGSPHHVKFVDSLTELDVYKEGRLIRYTSNYSVNGVNVNFVLVQSCNELQPEIYVRTYERGVEDETLSCGTGAVAAAIVTWKRHCTLSQRTDVQHVSFKVNVKHGAFRVTFTVQNGEFFNIRLYGPVAHIFDGVYFGK